MDWVVIVSKVSLLMGEEYGNNWKALRAVQISRHRVTCVITEFIWSVTGIRIGSRFTPARVRLGFPPVPLLQFLVTNVDFSIGCNFFLRGSWKLPSEYVIATLIPGG